MKKTIAIILSFMMLTLITIQVSAISSINVKSMKLNKSSINLKHNETFQLNVTFTPENTSQKLLIYATANKNVATVDKDGKITAVGAGTTTVTVINYAKKNIVAKCTVGVATKNFKYTYANMTQIDQKNDMMYKIFTQKFNVDIVQIMMTWDNWNEKIKTMVASGDTPDIMWTLLPFSSYVNFVKNGALKEIPADLSRYPNLKDATEKASSFWKDRMIDGKHYIYPLWQIRSTEFNKDLVTPYGVVFYRKDWSDKLGFNKNLIDTATPTELLNMGKAFIEKDPGGLGKGKTIGYVGDGWSYLRICGIYLQFILYFIQEGRW